MPPTQVTAHLLSKPLQCPVDIPDILIPISGWISVTKDGGFSTYGKRRFQYVQICAAISVPNLLRATLYIAACC
jgi:hypothetical protein